MIGLNTIEDLEKLDVDSVVQDSIDIVRGIESNWSKAKTYKYGLKHGTHKIAVETFTKKLKGDDWHGRVCNFETISDAMKEEYYKKLDQYVIGNTEGLELTHTEFEKEYIHELVKFKLLPSNLEYNHDKYAYFSYVAVLHYALQFPLKKRIFYELIHVMKSKSGSESYVISQPIKPPQQADPKESAMVHAKYSSIEMILYDKTSNKLKWSMATCANSGGLIPKWLADWSMNAVIAKDVPSFLNWSGKLNTSAPHLHETPPTKF